MTPSNPIGCPLKTLSMIVVFEKPFLELQPGTVVLMMAIFFGPSVQASEVNGIKLQKTKLD